MKKLVSTTREVLAMIRRSRLLSTMLLLILTLALLTTASVAWVTMNRKTDSDGMDMSLAMDDTDAVYTAYMYDLENEAGTDTGKDSEGNPVALTITNLDLNQYDSVFAARNRYTPAFAKITLTRYSHMKKNGKIILTIERDLTKASEGSLADLRNDPTASTVLRFTAFVDETKEDLAKTNADELYRYINSEARFAEVNAYGGEVPNSATFTTITITGTDANGTTTGTYSKTERVTLEFSYNADCWYTKDGKESMNVYLYITYDVNLIESFMGNDEAEADSENISLSGNTVTFENDFTRVTVGYENAPESEETN